MNIKPYPTSIPYEYPDDDDPQQYWSHPQNLLIAKSLIEITNLIPQDIHTTALAT